MNKAVTFSTFARNAATAVIIISLVCDTLSLNWTSDSVFPLDMATESVDDQYIGCENNMEKLIMHEILPQELKLNEMFGKAWKEYENISDNYTRSIKVYTAPNVFSDFNINVRLGRNIYKDKFNYKAFHFFLTRGIQIRKVNTCTDVFRRTSVDYDTNVLGREMRFGQFASSSLIKGRKNFGRVSCFKIKTCYGVDISNISVFPKEKEVLIPPYESFNITNIEKDGNEMNCKVLYTLESSGKFSNMNCELLKKRRRYKF
ncbi:hypothetical protein AMELA_G00110090 [Ameiurus melas]|uniref:NAD(P)(+)--arginine ADP-ribosyltransferase n=1 Tax=Ameiurus melas TaxID=219545 RepID=A0A7J6AQD4_AMEME|nr:hypothetical protein AMELA_G00110090 [Ameiurus melas]